MSQEAVAELLRVAAMLISIPMEVVSQKEYHRRTLSRLTFLCGSIDLVT